MVIIMPNSKDINQVAPEIRDASESLFLSFQISVPAMEPFLK